MRPWSLAQKILKASAVCACLSGAAGAHPHVFVDGGVDFVFSEPSILQRIEVTWLYDPLETLYVLSILEIDPGSDWQLTDAQRAEVIAHESNWTATFDGAARLARGLDGIALEPPRDFAVRLIGNQLEVRFSRDLTEPVDIGAGSIETTFFEDTFFFAFSIANTPKLLGDAAGCSAQVDPFDPDTQSAELQETLMRLGREETPEDLTVGRFFTDRIYLSCV